MPPKKTQREIERDADYKKEVARRVQAAIDMRGRRQAWVAEEAGLDRTILTRIVTGQRKASSDQLTAIARVLDVPVDALTPDGPEPETLKQDRCQKTDTLSPAADRVPLERFLEVARGVLTKTDIKKLELLRFSIDREGLSCENWLKLVGIYREVDAAFTGGGRAGRETGGADQDEK